MRAAGLYHGEHVRRYFEQVGRHLSNALRIFRDAQTPEAVEQLARRHVEVDSSLTHIRGALNHGKGALIVPAHVCDYLLTLARLNLDVPVWVYLRWSKDKRRRELKRLWCEACGLPVILEPASAADPAARAAACVEVLQRGDALVMTPDIAQSSAKGVNVRLLNRTAYLPTGPALIAMLAEAPLLPVFGRMEDQRHMIEAHEPIFVSSRPRAEGGRREGIRVAMQAWTDLFEAFLTRSPYLWFLWADSRWTRVFRGDPKYCGEAIVAGGKDA